MEKRSGKIDLKNGHSFHWMRASDGEITGFIETPKGGVLKGSSDWWRTEDPEKAAKAAEVLYL